MAVSHAQGVTGITNTQNGSVERRVTMVEPSSNILLGISRSRLFEDWLCIRPDSFDTSRCLERGHKHGFDN